MLIGKQQSHFSHPYTTGKQPKPKNQAPPQPKMGWENPAATHPHKQEKERQLWKIFYAV